MPLPDSGGFPRRMWSMSAHSTLTPSYTLKVIQSRGSHTNDRGDYLIITPCELLEEPLAARRKGAPQSKRSKR